MSSKKFMQLLNDYRACREASLWAEGKTFKKVWNTCERSDWMFWLTDSMVSGREVYDILPDSRWGSEEHMYEVRRRTIEAWDKALYKKNLIPDYIAAQKSACDVWRKYYEVI